MKRYWSISAEYKGNPVCIRIPFNYPRFKSIPDRDMV